MSTATDITPNNPNLTVGQFVVYPQRGLWLPVQIDKIDNSLFSIHAQGKRYVSSDLQPFVLDGFEFTKFIEGTDGLYVVFTYEDAIYVLHSDMFAAIARRMFAKAKRGVSAHTQLLYSAVATYQKARNEWSKVIPAYQYLVDKLK